MRDALNKGTTDYEDGSVKIRKSSVREVALNGSQIGPALKGPTKLNKIKVIAATNPPMTNEDLQQVTNPLSYIGR